MSLIVNGTEIENVIVVKSATGERVELEKFQDQNGNVIWELEQELKEVIIGLDVGVATADPDTTLRFKKNDDGDITIDWGDGTIDTITDSSVTSVSHDYAENKFYEIVISGTGTLKYLGAKGDSTTTISYPFISIRYGTSTSPSIGVVTYVKVGTICKGLANPFGLGNYGAWSQNLSYKRDTTDGNFYGGLKVADCYYNGKMNYFNYMKLQTTHFIVGNGDSVNSLGVFKTEKQTLLTFVGSGIGKDTLYQYNFDGVGYLQVTADQTAVFPESVVGVYGLLLSTGSTLKFLTPKGVKVTMGEGCAYYKSAVTTTIYTDNDDIKNYNWAGDNVTPTFYHLDGTLWE